MYAVLPQSSPKKRRVFFLAPFVFAIFWHLSLCLVVAQNPTQDSDPAGLVTFRPLLVGVGTLSFVSAIVWMHFKTRRMKIGTPEHPLSARQFRFVVVIALALSEMGTISALMLYRLGAPYWEFAFYAAVTLVIDVAFVLSSIL